MADKRSTRVTRSTIRHEEQEEKEEDPSVTHEDSRPFSSKLQSSEELSALTEPNQFATMTDLMQFMLLQDERRRKDEETWRRCEMETHRQEEEQRRREEEQRHQEFMTLQRQRLDNEEALRAAAVRQEEQHKKDKELDRRLRETPQLPKMKEDTDVEMFLVDFELHMRDLEIPPGRWLTNIRPLLSPWARGTVDILGEENRQQYPKVKETLLAAFASTKGSLGYRALTTGREKGQSAAQFLTGIHRRWKHWIGDLPMEEALAKVTMALGELHLPYGCKSYIQARKPITEQEMAACIDQFFAERGTSWDDPKWKSPKPLGTSWDDQKWKSPKPLGTSWNDQRWKSPKPFRPQWTGTMGGRDDSNQYTRQQENPTQDQANQPHDKQSNDIKSPRHDRPRERNAPTRGVCFYCGRKGHYAVTCPDRQVRVNKIAAPQSITVTGKVGDKEIKMMLDSGAAMSMFPAKMLDQKDYSGDWMKVKGAVGEKFLQTAVVTVEVEGEKADMCVLVTPEDTTPLLGMDYPHFDDTMLRKLAERLAQKENVPPHQPQEVLQVQTRKQDEKKHQQQQEDDEASATSGATPLDLTTLDDSLFGSSKERLRLTRSQKRAQAREKMEGSITPGHTRLTQFTPKELEEAQREDEDLRPLWEAAEENRNGFHIG